MAEQKSNDDSEDAISVSLDDEFKFDWRQSDNIQTIGDLCAKLNVDNVEGFILQLKDTNDGDRVIQEWELSTELDESIQWQDWNEHDYLDFYLIDTNPDVYLNGSYEFTWKESDNINTLRDLVTKLGIDWENISPPLQLWLGDDEEEEPYFHEYLTEENMDNGLPPFEVGDENNPELNFSSGWLYDDDTSSEESSSGEEEKDEEQVANDVTLSITQDSEDEDEVGVRVELDGVYKFTWYSSDHIYTVEDLKDKLGIEVARFDGWESNQTLQLWLTGNAIDFHVYLTDENMNNNLPFYFEGNKLKIRNNDFEIGNTLTFSVGWLYDDDNSSEESSSGDEEEKEEVADDTDADLANQMRRMRMTSRDAASAQARLEDEQSESRRTGNDPKRKRVLPQLQLRF